MRPPEQRVPRSISFGANLRNAIASGTMNAAELREGVLGEITAAAASPAKAKVGRNDPCPCGSGKKFKKCCGR